MPDQAARLAALIPKERLEAAVRAWADASSRRQRWAVGFSGGADSLALLLLVWSHWPERRGRLRALHFDHRLRGRESRADASFCRQVCVALGVEFVSGAWAGSHRGATEAEARAARMAFFASQARVVWLGHQQDDVAESMLMRLARGSGTGGLAAPRPVQCVAGGRIHLRPLLALKKADLQLALREAGLGWREDSSNATGDFFRNRVRAVVLPSWIAVSRRDAVAGAARSRLLLEEDDAALETWLDALAPLGADGRLQLERLDGRPKALWRRALHRWLAANPRTGEPSRQAFDVLLAAVQTRMPTRQSLGRNGFAVSDGDELAYRISPRSRRKNRGRSN